MLKRLGYHAIPPEDEALRAPLRALLAEHMAGRPADLRARSWMGHDAELSRKLGRAGYIGLTFPKRYGGGGRSAFARFVVVEELLAVGAPVAAHWIADRQSGPLLLNFGTEAQKERYLPGIARGVTYFCIGMSEPDSGSDLASIRTRAGRTADGWRLDGQKIWTTGAQHADFMIALARTGEAGEGKGGRHEGLSQLIVDLRAPGVTVRPIPDLAGDEHFCEVFFDGVRLAPDALVGTEGAGWAQVTAELAFERSGPERIYSSVVLLDAWIGHLARNGADAEATRLVGALTAELTALRMASLAVTALLAAGEKPATEASLVKDLGTSFEQDVPARIGDYLAAHPDEPVEEELLRTLFYLSAVVPSFSLRGGTREILRGIIARGLGLR